MTMTVGREYEQKLDLSEARRPAGVTAIAILCWLLGALDILLLGILIVSNSRGDYSTGELVGVGAVGLVYIAAGIGLFLGVDAARVVVLLGSLVSFASGLYAAGNGQLVFGIATVAVTVAIAILLWTGRGSEWFTRDREP
jgi:hypothetical protein